MASKGKRKADQISSSSASGSVPSLHHIVNFYDIMGKDKKYKEEQFHYPNESKVQIPVPFMMGITGKTGSGKTNVLIDLILTKINCWTKIWLCAKDPDEPLYRWLTDQIREVEKRTESKILHVVNDVSKLPSVETFQAEVPKIPKTGVRDPSYQILFIFDDFICDNKKKLEKIEQFYIMARKIHGTCINLSQEYYGTPKRIRKNQGYAIFKHIAQETDLKRILRDYDSLDVSYKKLSELYHKAVDSGEFNFFMIDLNTKDDNLKFRINYEGIPATEWKKTEAEKQEETETQERKRARKAEKVEK